MNVRGYDLVGDEKLQDEVPGAGTIVVTAGQQVKFSVTDGRQLPSVLRGDDIIELAV